MSRMRRRSQEQRIAATRQQLLQAAREEFVEHGYSAATTTAILERTAVTRGALYHHFTSKLDLFRGVVEAEAGEVRARIESAVPVQASTIDALIAGTLAFLDAMTAAGRTRLLLVDAPSVLGLAEATRIDEENAAATLVSALRDVQTAGHLAGVDVTVLALLLSAAFDRAALAVDQGHGQHDVRHAVIHLIQSLLLASSDQQTGLD